MNSKNKIKRKIILTGGVILFIATWVFYIWASCLIYKSSGLFPATLLFLLVLKTEFILLKLKKLEVKKDSK